MKTSPNDANRVVWAISTCFFFYLFTFFSLLIYIYKYYRSYGATDRLTGGYNEKNGPKRMHITSFGPFISYYYYYSCFFTFTDYITHFHSNYWYDKPMETLRLTYDEENGPNDAFRVVSAISKSFFLLLITLLLKYTCVRFI